METENKKRDRLIKEYRKQKLDSIDFEIKWGKRILIAFMIVLISIFIYKYFINT